MPLSRRTTIALLGGGILSSSVVSLGYVANRRPEEARKPWGAAGRYDDPRLFALSYAILAPNPHNRQPWLVDLRRPHRVVVYRDAERDLPATDPFQRQLTIGLGCFLELMNIAAREAGYTIDFSLYPEGESGPVAVADFRSGAEADPLFRHILDRRSCKEAYSDRPVPSGPARAVSALSELVTDSEKVGELRQLTRAAWETEMYTPHTLRESVELMRFGAPAINRSPDGISVGGGMLEVLVATGLLDAESQIDTDSAMFREGMRRYHELLMATPAYAVITTPGNSRLEQIEAGRRWLRLNLTTTALGLSLHPVSQALQEYPEMRPHYREVHRLLAKPGYTVQMLGRLGYGPRTAPSPRWALETRIQNG